MKKTLLFTGLLLCSLIGYNQAPTIYAGLDTTLCPPACANLSAVFTGGGNTTNYTVGNIAFAPDANAGTSINLSDDSQTGLLPIGFTFCFFGQTYTQFVICSNNWIGFSTGQTSTWVTNTIPSTAGNRPKNVIMGPWHDINPGIGGTIKYQTLGVAPFRRLVVTYSNVPMYSCTSMQFTSQIIIYETTNEVENHISAKPLCTSWNGGNAVQGLHDITGTIAVVNAGRNNTQWTATNEGIRFTPNGPPTVEWYVGATLIGTGPNITVCPAITTQYVAHLVSCGVTVATDTVIVNAVCCVPPTMTYTDVTCFGACDGTGIAAGNGTAPYTYQWDAAAGNQTTAIATGLCPGTYTVTVTDATGCIELGQVTISEPTALTGSIIAQTDVSCNGGTDGTVDVTASGGITPLTYDIGLGPQATGSFTGLTAGPYTVTVTDSNLCTYLIPLTILEPVILSVSNVGQTDVSCNGGTDGTVDVIGADGIGPYQYSIDGGVTLQASTNFGGLAAGPYIITVEDANLCQSTVNITINEPTPVVVAMATVTEPSCFGFNDGDLTVSGSGGIAPYQYSIDGGITFQGSTAFGALAMGTYTITIEDANTCQSTVNITVNEPVLLTLGNVLVDETCINDCLGSINLTGAGGTGAYTYSISNCNSPQANGLFNNLCASNYSVCVTDANGCVTSDNLTVQVGLQYADATITPIGPFCANDAPTVLTSVTGGGTWSGTGVSGNSFDPSISGEGVFTITNTISTTCGDIATYDIAVNPLPNISFMADITSGCAPITVNFTNTSSPGLNCSWDFGNGSANSCVGVLQNYNDGGTYDVSLTVTTSDGCMSTLTIPNYITVYDVPTANFVYLPQTTTILNPTINFNNGSNGEIEWNWDFGGAGSSTLESPVFSFSDTGNYDVTLIVTGNGGCTDTISQNVYIADELLIYVPNVFTPDGSGYNDYFLPIFNAIDPYNYSMFIYDRWGEVLFETHNLEIGWDGTYGNAGLVEDGVYIWKIEVDDMITGDALKLYGHVTVLK